MSSEKENDLHVAHDATHFLSILPIAICNYWLLSAAMVFYVICDVSSEFNRTVRDILSPATIASVCLYVTISFLINHDVQTLKFWVAVLIGIVLIIALIIYTHARKPDERLWGHDLAHVFLWLLLTVLILLWPDVLLRPNLREWNPFKKWK
jgi:uncharacterized membrane protein